MTDHREAYEDMLRRYMPALRRLAGSYTREGFEDLFQEIAVALWTALPRFRGDCSERTWVYRVAHNTAIRFTTNANRRSRCEQSGDLPEAVGKTDPEGDVIQHQMKRRLWEAVQALPLADRQIVGLHLEGLSAAEIEAVTGTSSGAVATRLTRIRQRLSSAIHKTEAAT
jgi:RNA polymerase sigma-70 factor (ECF subfamily)